MKYCIKCLCENDDSAEKCAQCGYKFGQNLDVLSDKWEKPKKEKKKKSKGDIKNS